MGSYYSRHLGRFAFSMHLHRSQSSQGITEANNFHSMLPTDERDLQRVRSRRRLKTFSSLSLFLSFCFLSDSGMLETDSTVNFSISAVFLVWDFFAMFN